MTTTIWQTNLPNLLYRGKVRDTYDLGKGILLMVATDRISAFDVVLPTAIPEKGVVLAKLSAFWFRQTAHLFPNHFLAMADEPEAVRIAPQVADLPPEIRRRAMLVRRAKRVDVEAVVRGYLAGSAWAEYRSQGTVHGQPMPKGLREGERLPQPLFTPTTKATTGHDQPLSFAQVVQMVGQSLAERIRDATIQVYSYAHQWALQKGIIIADTKMEFGLVDGQLILIDELLTPDSSRFWDAAGYQPGKSLPNFDKQFVRDWLTQSGWNKEPPAPALPPDIVEKTRQRYLEAYRRLTGKEL
ncbi:MAG: phosphoribosylaminoimidazolesuccinocarboxamide synthase [Dehalococcoidia bacterium]|nr:phosphoribosylaminoimidazolesuccinocarboxamide synthase [Dehalococcoidia bacterium]MDW8120580.1 phosphoribosylaminoimidazolesuccinocarboxamide synthase [Chloroflexota bacterium]